MNMDNFVIDSDQIYNYLQDQIEIACFYRRFKYPPKFIPFYVKLLLLNPKWQIGDTSDIISERKYFESFIKHCLDQLSLKRNNSMETLKMQKFFIYHLDSVTNIIEIKRTNLKLTLKRLESDIMNVIGTDDDTLRELNRKIVYYMTLLTGLGNPTDARVYNEALTALQSVFDHNDLLLFVNGSNFEKSDELERLTELVSGIRLFNRDCNRGGQGISDVIGILSKVTSALTENYQKNLVDIMDNVNTLTTAIDMCFTIEFTDSHYFLYCVVPTGVGYDDIEKIKDALTAYRQYEIITRRLLAEIENIDTNSKYLQKKLEFNFQKLHNLVNHHTAIPAVIVYPLFSNIAYIWQSLQNHIIKLSSVYALGENVRDFEKEIFVNKKITKEILGDNEPLTDAERLERTTGQIVDGVNNPNVKILFPNEIRDFDKVPLQYLGFCAWKLVKSNGGLFPGNPNIGVLQYNDNNYVFSSVEAAKVFASNPDRYINQALAVVREKPELINLLQLFDDLFEKKDIEDIADYTPRQRLTSDIEVQTVMHPIETKIDKNYKWNVWDLRRQALLLANMSACKTHSMQTVKSTFKNDVKMQTYDSKEKIIQTKSDNYTNVPTLSNFIYGLRGRKDDRQFIIELTRPVDE